MLMTIMKDVKRKKNGRWQIPTIVIQTKQPRYRLPQNPPGCPQIMQAINVSDDQVRRMAQHVLLPALFILNATNNFRTNSNYCSWLCCTYLFSALVPATSVV